MPSTVELIAKKRDGVRLTPSEIQALVAGLLDGGVADYQMAAFLMATYFRGMDREETLALTQAMLRSGKVLTLPSVRLPKVDKHSTGGVGDKISLCLGPLVAACGVAVPMISGRGLGHTGGTLDKLEAIPGYRVNLSATKFERIVASVGVSMIGQTRELAPADRRIYALRDVTATVECVPLIVASILSKKLAEGIDALVLDVKVGRGAFMKDLGAARRLARALVHVGGQAGKRVVALLTDMSAPIGRSIGNAIETREAIDVLMDRGPADTRELTLLLGVEMLLAGGVVRGRAEARRRLEQALATGRGLETFARMVHAHGGDARLVENPERLPKARVRLPVTAPRAGYVAALDALELGLVGVALGAGRARAEQKVDPAAGIEIAAPPGTRVERGERVLFLHARNSAVAEVALERARHAVRIAPRAPAPRKRVLGRL